MLKNRINYDTIQDLKRQTGRPIETLLAQTRHTDPFYLQAGRLLNARWFADLFHEYGFGRGTHLRRVHYRIVSQETVIRRPNGEPYENTAVCWQELCDAGKDARYAGHVDIEDFVDRRTPEAFRRLAESVDEPGSILPRFRLRSVFPTRFRTRRLFFLAIVRFLITSKSGLRNQPSMTC